MKKTESQHLAEEEDDDEFMKRILREEKAHEEKKMLEYSSLKHTADEHDEDDIMKEILEKEAKEAYEKKSESIKTKNDESIKEPTPNIKEEVFIDEQVLREPDDLNEIDEKTTKDPLEILSKYIEMTRLRSKQNLSLQLTNILDKDQISRIFVSKKIPINDADKTLGKPTCISTNRGISIYFRNFPILCKRNFFL